MTLLNQGDSRVRVDRGLFAAKTNGIVMNIWGEAGEMPESLWIEPGSAVSTTVAWYYAGANPQPGAVVIRYDESGQNLFAGAFTAQLQGT